MIHIIVAYIIIFFQAHARQILWDSTAIGVFIVVEAPSGTAIRNLITYAYTPNTIKGINVIQVLTTLIKFTIDTQRR